MSPRLLPILASLLLATLAITSPGGAHPMSVSELRLEIQTGALTAELFVDAPSSGETAVQRARALEREVRSGLFLKIDGAPLHYALRVADLGDPTAAGNAAADRLELSTPLPPEARSLSLRSTSRFGALRVHLSEAARGVKMKTLLPASETTQPFPLRGELDPLVLEGWTPVLGEPSADLSPAPLPGPLDLRATATHYVRLGFEHILPLGLDHVLFVLALFFLSPRLKPLLLQLTAFTLAHSLSLALVAAGIMSPPATVVEPLIAASIVFVGVENLQRRRPGPWRVAVVVLFGLLHGMGFADALHELGLPDGREWVALVAFNVGVELGQIAVVLMALALTWRLRVEGEHPRWVRVPASGAIALMGLFWMFERVLL